MYDSFTIQLKQVGVCKRPPIRKRCPENIIQQLMNVQINFNLESIRALIVFGGEAERGRSLDSLDALFIDDWKWRKLALKKCPPPR